ncbi:Jag N-terminal domain-containing protein [Desulfovibrio sp. OttesenSCG-928-I05]|nr:Jag N-terminal domain-containing protein [Desulfovibrio sp. OttesenSCG-928-I05]
MSDYREFQGKTLDSAIKAACDHFDVPREKLDIEIISDAKGGIFGLVGARKAAVRARLVHIESIMDDLDGAAAQAPRGKDARRNGSDRNKKPREERSQKKGRSDREEPAAHTEPEDAGEGSQQNRKNSKAPAAKSSQDSQSARKGAGRGRGKPAGEDASARNAEDQNTPAKGNVKESAEKKSAQASRKAAPKSPARPQKESRAAAKAMPEARPAFPNDDENGEDLPRVPLSSLDATLVQEAAREVIARLVEPMLGECAPSVSIEGETIRISIEAGEDPGLLIGREGQNLAAVQYLATRMLAGKLQCRVKLHVDAGDYRQRQDDRLRDLALALAEKARSSGKPQLTRPLSSYQRRVIHVTLQDEDDMQTHSKGEGDLKRVVIAPRRSGNR